jgi:AcrR family transcriptional regulator
MGRKLAFSKDDALRTAMRSFWAKGYDNTSMRDLAAQLQLHLGSLYNALGDKDRVFEAALQMHIDEHLSPRLERLKSANDPLRAVEEYLQDAIDDCTNAQDRPGCFIFNSLPEIRRVNGKVNAMLDAYYKDLEAAISICLQRAQNDGLISTAQNAASYSRFLIGTVFSLRAIAKLEAPIDHLRDVKNCAIRALAPAA